jgi:two-component system, OmpR family, sensor histidine kinase KdpD
VGVAAITVTCSQLQSSFAVCSFLFLILILVQSLTGDLPVSALVSVEAVVCLEYFFVDPRASFTIAHGEDAIALVAFLSAALVVTRLVSRVSAEAAAARLERQRQARLYRLAQQLLVIEPQVQLSTALPERFRAVFEMTAVAILDVDTVEIQVAGNSARNIAAITRQAYLDGRDVNDDFAGIAVRRLQVGGRTIGCIGFEGLDDAGVVAEPLAALAAMFLERMRALRNATETVAAAQTELYRGAILDALAHEFKTPLATILAAAGGVREAGPLDPAQVDMMETVETEAARLGSLTSRLLRMARVEREEVRPRMEAINLVSLVERLTDQYARRSPDRRIVFVKSEASFTVHADAELLGLAVGQLLENACKYSQPGSNISICMEDRDGFIEIGVSNSGSSIHVGEQHRIFDRFFRGSGAALTPGSGLGLYVARKIALAHGGALDLAAHVANGHDVSFRFRIPSIKSETDHVVTAG